MNHSGDSKTIEFRSPCPFLLESSGTYHCTNADDIVEVNYFGQILAALGTRDDYNRCYNCAYFDPATQSLRCATKHETLTMLGESVGLVEYDRAHLTQELLFASNVEGKLDCSSCVYKAILAFRTGDISDISKAIPELDFREFLLITMANNRLHHVLMQAEEAEGILEMAYKVLRDILGIKSIIVYLVGEGGTVLLPMGTSNTIPATIELGNSPPKWIESTFVNNRGLSIELRKDCEEHAFDPSILQEGAAGTVYVLPIRTENEPVGSLMLHLDASSTALKGQASGPGLDAQNLVRTQMLQSTANIVGWAIRSTQLLKATAANEAKYRNLFQLAPDAIIALTSGGDVLAINKEAARMFYLSADTPPAQLKSEIMAKFADAGLASELLQLVTGVRTTIGPQIAEIRNIEGIPIQIEVRGAAFHDDEGNRQMCQLWIKDITDFAMSERELNQSVSVIRAVLENMSDAALFLNEEGAILATNDKAGALFRCPSQSLIATRLVIWFKDVQSIDEFLPNDAGRFLAVLSCCEPSEDEDKQATQSSQVGTATPGNMEVPVKLKYQKIKGLTSKLSLVFLSEP